MDVSHESTGNTKQSLSPDSSIQQEQQRNDIDNADHAGTRKRKSLDDDPSIYSQNVRRKQAGTNRTGQACDRCKERKMKCDTNKYACKPCADKNLRCYTTDRVTGQARQRGQGDRSEAEIQCLKEELQRYKKKFGLLADDRFDNIDAASSLPTARSPMYQRILDRNSDIPDSEYVGWPAPEYVQAIYPTPIDGMVVDMLDWGKVDLSTSDCCLMRESEAGDEDAFNFSQKAVLRTIFKLQVVTDLQLPDRAAAIQHTNNFFAVLWGFVPIVHKRHFMRLVEHMYDSPQELSMPQRVQVLVMLAIMTHQDGIRNHQLLALRKKQAYSCFHTALYNYSEMAELGTMEGMQALAMLLIVFRNMPKPGFTWRFAQLVLLRAIELNYHRDPQRIWLPAEQRNPLSHELRKRIFHSILGICVTTGCRIGRPSPSQYAHWDVPLPEAVLDEEISEAGFAQNLSGECDYRPCIQLARLLPLFTELFDYVLSTRRTGDEYTKIVDILHSKIDKWKQEWTTVTADDTKNDHYDIVTVLLHSWHAEFRLYLYHPSVCTSTSPHVQAKTQRACLFAARDLLAIAQRLIQSKATDFTWHSMVAYALGCGVYAHMYRKSTGYLSDDDHKKICNDFAGWRSLMYYADLVMCTNNFMKSIFEPILRQVVSELNNKRDRDASTQANAQRRSMAVAVGTAALTQIKTEESTSSSVTPQMNGIHLEHQPPAYTQAPQQWLVPAYQSQSTDPPTKGLNAPATTYTPFISGVTTVATMTQPAFTNVPFSLGTILNGDGQYHMYKPAEPDNTVSSVNERGFVFTPQFFTESTEQNMWPQTHNIRHG